MKDLSSFLAEAIIKHGNKFNYEKAVYTTSETALIVTCPVHGDTLQTPYNHIRSKHGCKKCGESSAAISKQKDLTSFITKAQSIHGDKYDYTKSVYKSAKEKIIITCPDHGDFEQLVSGHLSGYGCKHCASHGKGRVDMSKPCTLYYLHLPDLDYYKIGITSLSVDHRYRTTFDREQFTVVFTKLYPTGREAYEEEQKLLSTFSHLKHVRAKVLSAGNTEIFTKDIFNGDYTTYTTKAI